MSLTSERNRNIVSGAIGLLIVVSLTTIGIKASFGRVPAWPPSPFASVSHLGPMTRTVPDAALMLTVLARPISVLASSVVSPLPWRDLMFLSWAGLRGAVPIVLMTIPLAEGVEDAPRLFDVVFVMVVIYTLLTGPTLPLVARWLGVDRRHEPRDIELEAAPLERIAADLLQVTITPASRLHGVEVGELRLPTGASVSMLVRDGQSLVPERRTVLKRGDDMLVVTPRRLRQATERRLRDVSIGGRLAQWLPDE